MREDFKATMGELDTTKLHFVDECATHDAMVPTHGRAPRGERATGTKPKAKGRHLTVIGSLSLRSGLDVSPWQGSMKGADFASWVECMLLPRLREGDIVILDNCSIHKVDEVAAMVESRGASIRWLPPYSPDLNPIEEAWSKFKSILRRIGASTMDMLVEAVTEAAGQVTISDTMGYVRHAGYSAST
jgi:hypothetical protein